MLDGRIYRSALLAILPALLVAAFALQDRPRPIGTTLAPDAFDGARAAKVLDQLAGAHPDRRPGSPDDTALARELQGDLQSALRLGDGAVRVQRFDARTIDGRQSLENVIATRPGAAGPGIVVVAHRDAAAPGARAELSGTAALLELARVAGAGRLRRTITFASTSGGSGGNAGARALVRALPGPVDAVLVLGDVGSARTRKPYVVGFSDARGMAPLRLRRTVEAALRAQTGTDPGSPRAVLQWARQAVPVTLGEQGPLAAAGLPAVLISATGERGPRSGDEVAPARLQAFGSGVLRAITALDNGPAIGHGPQALLVTQRKVLPLWAIRLLIGAALLPVLLTTIDGAARARRRRHGLGRWLAWVLATALPFAVVAAAAVGLRAVGFIDPAPGGLLPVSELGVDGTARAALATLALLGVLSWLTLRRAALRAAGFPGAARGPRPDGPGAAAAVAVAVCALAVVLWVANPFAAALVLPAAHLWLLAAAPEVRLPRAAAVLAVLAGLLPFVALVAVDAASFGMGPAQAVWATVLLVAGGHISIPAWLVMSLLAGCAVCAGLVAAHPPAAEQPSAPGPRERGRGPAARRQVGSGAIASSPSRSVLRR